jgi:ribose-phosphate pyrophosphokinase
MRPILFELAAAPGLASGLAARTDCELGQIERRQFPDGESYVRLLTPVAGRKVVLLATLDRPDAKTLPLLFVADAARRQGAVTVGLLAPYMPYLRQDQAFHEGEAVTSQTFGGLLSGSFDWVATVDPHLHRYKDLREVFSIPAITASAASPIAAWIAENVDRPYLIGPDSESEQWVERIARAADAPYALLAKVRTGDFEVSLSGSLGERLAGRVPVLVDDIASSATTLIEAVGLLRDGGHPAPLCVVVHPIFAENADDRLLAAGAAAIVSTNTVAHASNRIDVADVLAEAISQAPFDAGTVSLPSVGQTRRGLRL